jgi:hypothetical protein
MQFGAIGSTVHGPEVMVKKVGGGGCAGGEGGGEDGEGGCDGGEGGDGGEEGGDGGGGEGGGDGGDGGCDGGDGYEHTRQPDLVKNQSELHSIVPGPKMKLEGPPPPWKLVNVPDGWLGMRRKSQPASVLKEVAVRGAPMASAVGVMEQL